MSTNSNAYTVPTHHLRFVRRLVRQDNIGSEPFEEYKFRLQQKWDTSTLKDGQWEVTSVWKDVPVENE